jgi:predicted transcriptional regulator
VAAVAIWVIEVALVGIQKRIDEINRASIRKGMEDIRAGRVISHERMVRWLRLWGMKHKLPPPTCK